MGGTMSSKASGTDNATMVSQWNSYVSSLGQYAGRKGALGRAVTGKDLNTMMMALNDDGSVSYGDNVGYAASILAGKLYKLPEYIVGGSSPLGSSSSSSTSSVSSSLATQKSLANSYGSSLSSTADLMEQQRLVPTDNDTSTALSSGSLLALGGTLG